MHARFAIALGAFQQENSRIARGSFRACSMRCSRTIRECSKNKGSSARLQNEPNQTRLHARSWATVRIIHRISFSSNKEMRAELTSLGISVRDAGFAVFEADEATP